MAIFPFNNSGKQNQSVGSSINANTVLALTPDGVVKANSPNLEGDFGNIISQLSAEQTAPIRQLAQLTGISESRIIDVARQNPVYIQPRRIGG